MSWFRKIIQTIFVPVGKNMNVSRAGNAAMLKRNYDVRSVGFIGWTDTSFRNGRRTRETSGTMHFDDDDYGMVESRMRNGVL
jgi:hypothetical protein